MTFSLNSYGMTFLWTNSTRLADDGRGAPRRGIVGGVSGGIEPLAGMLETARWRIEGTHQLYLWTSGPTAVRRARLTCKEHLAVLEPIGRSR